MDLVKIHRVNPKTKKAFTARSTGTNEVNHRELNAVLDAPSVGIARAERVMDDLYEASNDRKKVNRLGEQEKPTYRTEKLLFLNSIANSAGFTDVDLPFQPSVVSTKSAIQGIHGSVVRSSSRILTSRSNCQRTR
jgi:hypothetical protein